MTWNDESVVARFFAKTKRDTGGPETNGIACLEWTAHTNKKGYGKFWVKGFFSIEGVELKRDPKGGSMVFAHRWAYAYATGSPPPPGQHVDHRCCNSSCVEGRHLVEEDPSVNTARGNVTRHLPRAEVEDWF